SSPHTLIRNALRSPASHSSAAWHNASTCRQRADASVIAPPFELAQQPELRQPPIALDGVIREVEHVCGLFDAQPAEEPQFDHSALALVDSGQRVQRAIEGDDIQ